MVFQNFGRKGGTHTLAQQRWSKCSKARTPLNHHQDSIRSGLKVFLLKRWEPFGVVAGVGAGGFALSSTWLSAPLLASRMRISGNGSETVGTTPRSNVPGAEVRRERAK